METPHVQKKRGRRPKGGKIVVNKPNNNNNFLTNKPNIILHLKCKLSDLEENTLLTDLTYEPKVNEIEGFDNKEEIFNNNYSYEELNNNKQDIQIINNDTNNNKELEQQEIKLLWRKLKDLEISLINNIVGKKSCCFWCTYDYDNPSIVIPKYELENKYYVYGSFCSPQCAAAYLLNERIYQK